MHKLSIVAASFLLSTTAHAHTGAAGHDLAYGFAHPIGGLDHVLAMVAVGLLAAMLGGGALWRLPLCFMATMVAGFTLGMGQLDLPLVEAGIALSVIVIGGAIVSARRVSPAVAMVLVGAFSLLHGYAHGLEAPAEASPLPFVSGFITATALLHVVGLASTLAIFRLSERHGKSIVQTGGGAFVLSGVGLLFGWL